MYFQEKKKPINRGTASQKNNLKIIELLIVLEQKDQVYRTTMKQTITPKPITSFFTIKK